MRTCGGLEGPKSGNVQIPLVRVRGWSERLIFSQCAWFSVERQRTNVGLSCLVVLLLRPPPATHPSQDPTNSVNDFYITTRPSRLYLKRCQSRPVNKRPSMRTPSKLHTYVETAKCVLHFVAHSPWLTPQMYKRFHCRCFHLQLPMHSCGPGRSHVHLCRSVANKR